ncbi:MAG TPA: hypothetical protein VF753_20960 [Terriglobales bacterium]
MKTSAHYPLSWIATVTLGTILLAATPRLAAQTPYQPKFKGDPAHSDAEAVALGYIRTFERAQASYKTKNGKYASSLMDLVHVGSFTRRMAEPQHGDYTVNFHPRKDGYELTMTPKAQDADHRSFYVNEKGVIHADDQKQATEDSSPLK